MLLKENLLLGEEICVVCNSPYILPARYVVTRRTQKHILLKYCMACGSFSNPSGYKESEKQLEADVSWAIGVMERNTKWSKQLLSALDQEIGVFKSILEIGCGIGTFLEVTNDSGKNILGYDINQKAIEYGKEQYNIPLKCEQWNSQSTTEKYDVIISLSVLEHIEQPRPLIKEISEYCKSHGSFAFISVPFLDQDRWPYLLNADPYINGSPFFDNDVHVTHFSTVGLRMAFEEFGAKTSKIIHAGWTGLLFSF